MKVYVCCDSGSTKFVVEIKNQAGKGNDWNLTGHGNLPFTINPERELDIIAEEEIGDLVMEGGYERVDSCQMGDYSQKIFRNSKADLLYVVEVVNP